MPLSFGPICCLAPLTDTLFCYTCLSWASILWTLMASCTFSFYLSKLNGHCQLAHLYPTLGFTVRSQRLHLSLCVCISSSFCTIPSNKQGIIIIQKIANKCNKSTRWLAKSITQQEKTVQNMHLANQMYHLLGWKEAPLISVRVDKSPSPIPLQNQLSRCEFFIKGRQVLHWKTDPDSRKAKRSGRWFWLENYTGSLNHKGTQREKQYLADLYLKPEINY